MRKDGERERKKERIGGGERERKKELVKERERERVKMKEDE